MSHHGIVVDIDTNYLTGNKALEKDSLTIQFDVITYWCEYIHNMYGIGTRRWTVVKVAHYSYHLINVPNECKIVVYINVCLKFSINEFTSLFLIFMRQFIFDFYETNNIVIVKQVMTLHHPSSSMQYSRKIDLSHAYIYIHTHMNYIYQF